MMGGAVSGGIWGIHPDLGALDEGDMAYTMDYRSVYDLVLTDWFGLSKNRFKSFSNSIMSGILSA